MSSTTAAKEKVIERIVMAKRLGGLYQAEAAGLLRALYEATPAPEIYPTLELQQRYLLGFREGREMLRVAAQATGEPVRA